MANVVYKPVIEAVGAITPEQANKLPIDKICLIHGTRIVAGADIDIVGSTAIYTVPSGKIFLLLTAQVSIEFRASSLVESARLSIYDGADTSTLLAVGISNPVGTATGISSAAAISPSVPLLLKAGDILRIAFTEAGNGKARGSISGYEISASIFYNLL